ncbi:flagellin N-terminal helical domain-containing protein [Vibrio parahaemolyticus]|uniref:flagellin N-terminal helical domain-containing protein n=1 Tax=Vibrio parahaemolyticus TaxID=670 RepID=UPI00356B6B9D
MTSISSINTNAPAMQYQSQLTRSIDKQNTSMERLSSGLKINTAKDDAAGLQISNRLQVQSRGMDVAIRNANNGISVLQTAEGAMNEYTENLMQMRDLALRYANGSLSKNDQKAIEKEYSALRDELTRITEATSFGGKKLLNGKLSQLSFQIGSTNGEAIKVNLPDLGNKIDLQTVKTQKWVSLSYSDLDWKSKEGYSISLRNFRNGEHLAHRVNIAAGSTIYDIENYLNDEYGDLLTTEIELGGPGYHGLRRLIITSKSDEYGFVLDVMNKSGSSDITTSHTYQVDEEKTISDVKGRIPILTEATSGKSVIDQLDEVLHYVDSERSRLGATQNRLSHAINNLSQSSENVAASNRQIRDTDFAKEATELTKQSILREVNTSMLAQAGNAPRSALNLLS